MEHIQAVSEIRVLILTSGRTRQFIKFSLQHFAKFEMFSKIVCSPIFTKRVVYFCD
jgi:hypothetical protein